MTEEKKKKPRITPDQITEIKRLFRNGKSMAAIAREIGIHRQTVKMHIREKQGDILADEVRKSVLTEELRSHFKQLSDFAIRDLKFQLDASPMAFERPRLTVREKGPIFKGGPFAVPNFIHPDYIYLSLEWMRMHNPPPRDIHLLKALRLHTSDSVLWEYWDKWHKNTNDFEKAGLDILEHVEDAIEHNVLSTIEYSIIETIQPSVFGYILQEASGIDHAGLSFLVQTCMTGEQRMSPNEETKAKEQKLYKELEKIIEDIKGGEAFKKLKESLRQLNQSNVQLELRHIAKEIDKALVSIELMHAFPGKCDLCPV